MARNASGAHRNIRHSELRLPRRPEPSLCHALTAQRTRQRAHHIPLEQPLGCHLYRNAPSRGRQLACARVRAQLVCGVLLKHALTQRRQVRKSLLTCSRARSPAPAVAPPVSRVSGDISSRVSSTSATCTSHSGNAYNAKPQPQSASVDVQNCTPMHLGTNLYQATHLYTEVHTATN